MELRINLLFLGLTAVCATALSATEPVAALDPGAKIVMVSALGQEALVMEALQAGASDYVVKPFKPDAVVSTLRKVLEKKDV